MLQTEWSRVRTPEISKNRVIRALRWASIDLVVVFIAYAAAYYARTLNLPTGYNRWLFILLGAFVTILVSYSVGLYHRLWNQTSGHNVTNIMEAIGVSMLVMLAINGIVEPQPLPYTVIFFAHVLLMFGSTTVRYRSRMLSGAKWRWRAVWNHEFPKHATRVLIIGAGEAGQTIAWRMKHRQQNDRHRVVGFIDDDTEKFGMYVEGVPVFGNRHSIPIIAEAHSIDLIVLAIHNIDGPDFREILRYCEQSQARIKVVPDTLAMINARLNGNILRDVQPQDLIGRRQISAYDGVNLEPVMRKRVLVTGAAGSIGSELSRQMATYEPAQLLILDNNESNLHDLNIELRTKFPNLNLVSLLVDVSREEAVAEIFDTYRPQIVFHAAAYKHVPMMESFPEEAIRVNVKGTRIVAEQARYHLVERFVLISTDKAVNPTSVMGASKRLCELEMHALMNEFAHDTLFTVVRFGNVLGSRGSVVPTFNKQLDAGGPITITDDRITRNFKSIAEAVNLVIHAACLTAGDDIFVLKMGELVRIVDIAERMIRLRGMRPHADIEIKVVGARPGEKLYEELYDSAEMPTETKHPHITRLSQWMTDLPPKEILSRIDHLIECGLKPDVPPLQYLTELAEATPSQPVPVASIREE